MYYESEAVAPCPECASDQAGHTALCRHLRPLRLSGESIFSHRKRSRRLRLRYGSLWRRPDRRQHRASCFSPCSPEQLGNAQWPGHQPCL